MFHVIKKVLILSYTIARTFVILSKKTALARRGWSSGVRSEEASRQRNLDSWRTRKTVRNRERDRHGDRLRYLCWQRRFRVCFGLRQSYIQTRASAADFTATAAKVDVDQRGDRCGVEGLRGRNRRSTSARVRRGRDSVDRRRDTISVLQVRAFSMGVLRQGLRVLRMREEWKVLGEDRYPRTTVGLRVRRFQLGKTHDSSENCYRFQLQRTQLSFFFTKIPFTLKFTCIFKTWSLILSSSFFLLSAQNKFQQINFEQFHWSFYDDVFTLRDFSRWIL